MTQPALSVHKLDAALGARVEGLDLSQPLEPGLVAEIRGLLFEHQVLFFRNQVLDDADQIRFASYFGKPNVYPLNEMLGRLVAKRKVALFDLDASGCERRRQPGLIAPHGRRLYTGGRGHMATKRFEQLADEAGGSPVRHAEFAARFADPQKFGRGLLLIWGKHDTEGRNHTVKAIVRKRQRLGIGDFERHVQPFRLSPISTFV